MPLAKGSSSQGTISSNIKEMIAAGHPQKQAVAAAMRAARQGRQAGGEVDPVPQLNAQGLYSQAAKSAMALGQTKGSPQQMLASLKGVKPDEMKWSGAQDAFAGQPSVTKQQLAGHFQAALPQIGETMLGGRPGFKVTSPNEQPPAAWFDNHPDAQAEFQRREQQGRPGWHGLIEKPEGGKTKFGEYTIPGGTNYRELLMHLPSKRGFAIHRDEKIVSPIFAEPNQARAWAQAHGHAGGTVRAAGPDDYHSSHWNEPNVLAHLRMSDRRDQDSAKVLHLEELQSDWAQQGRKEGFKDRAKLADARRRMMALHAEKERFSPKLDKVGRPLPWADDDRRRFDDLTKQHEDAWKEMHAAAAGHEPAPYVTKTEGWTDLGLKRLLHEAAKGDYDKVAYTPGQDQADRYDLSKHVKHIDYYKREDGSYALGMGLHNGDRERVAGGSSIPEDKLADHVGKEVAEKIIADRGEAVGGSQRRLSGLDLKVGGSGMKGYYDNILPKRLLALAKEHDPDARLEGVYLSPDGMGEKAHKYATKPFPGLTITPRMRESILRNGFKAYAFGGRVALARGGAPPPEFGEGSGYPPEDIHGLTKLPIMETAAPYRPGQRNVTDVGKDLVARGQNFWKRRGVKNGRVEATTATAQHNDALAEAVANETEHALAGRGNAANWYSEKFEEAKRVAALSHPEIMHDPHALSAWAAALAITSQGEKVHRNAELADQLYQRFKDNGGRFHMEGLPGNDTKKIASKQGKAMVANFRKYDDLTDRYGHAGAHEFLNKPMKAAELAKAGYKLGSGLTMDADTHGSAIFGPKIGGGFYQNLMGNYHPVTQDLWFMRTFGRLTGTLMDTVKTEKGRQATYDRFENALNDLRLNRKTPTTKAGLAKEAMKWAGEHERNFAKYRDEYDSGVRTKDEIHHAAGRLDHMLHGVLEDPGNGRDRQWRAAIVNRARHILHGRGHNITNADLQATIWYPEKDLWRHMGSTAGAAGQEGSNVDYSQAQQRLARGRGHTDDHIKQALGRELDPDERVASPPQAQPNDPRAPLGRPGPAGGNLHDLGGVQGGGGQGGPPDQPPPPPAPGLAPPGYAAGGEVAAGEPPNPVNTKTQSQVGNVRFDQEHGAGQVPNNQNVNYLGFTAMMKPSKFLSLSHKLDNPTPGRIEWLRDHLEAGHAIGSPFLRVETNDEDPEGTFGKVHGHDGRHRMRAIQALQGDTPVPVHVFGSHGDRARHLTPEHIAKLRARMVSQGSTRESNDNFEDAFHLGKILPARPQRAEGGGFPHASKPHVFHSNLHGHHLHVGPIHSAVHGRTDHLPMHVPSGSYVLPADVVSAHGEGNTTAGFKVMHRLFGGAPYGGSSGPYGQGGGPYGQAMQNRATGGRVNGAPIFKNPALPRLQALTQRSPEGYLRGLRHGDDHYWWDGSKAIHADGANAIGIPYDYRDRLEASDSPNSGFRLGYDVHGPPPSLKKPSGPSDDEMLAELGADQSRGGRAQGVDRGVPIVAAGGEYVLSPDQVRAVGNGDADLGTKVLDEFVLRSRAKNIKTLQKLPGPAKD